MARLIRAEVAALDRLIWEAVDLGAMQDALEASHQRYVREGPVVDDDGGTGQASQRWQRVRISSLERKQLDLLRQRLGITTPEPPSTTPQEVTA